MEESKMEEKQPGPENTDGKIPQPQINPEELGKEAAEALNAVKDTFKKTDFKKDSAETKGFFFEMVKNPIEKIGAIANDGGGAYFKFSIILLIIWTAAMFLQNLAGNLFSRGFRDYFENFIRYLWEMVKSFVTPSIIVIIWSLIIFIFNKAEKKSLLTVINVVVAAKLPVIAAAVINLLNTISGSIYIVTVPIRSFCTMVSAVLLYFGLKEIMGKDESDSGFIKTAVLIFAVYYAAGIILRLLGIYI